MLNIIKYDNANALEATWLDADGKQISSIAYSDVQMDLLRTDVAKYGGDLTDYEALIAEVEANIQPYVEPVKTQEQINQEAMDYLNSTDWYVVRFVETAVVIPQEILDARQEARSKVNGKD